MANLKAEKVAKENNFPEDRVVPKPVMGLAFKKLGPPKWAQFNLVL
jgi:hypothetical protein